MEFSVQVSELSFDIGDIEPLFGTIALYDINTKTKVTEDFDFHLNTKEHLSALKIDTKDPLSRSLEAIFRIDPNYAIPSVYMIITIKKVLKGDLENIWDAYIKGKELKSKEKSKITEDLKESLKALASYRQCLLYSYVPLFSDNGNLKHNGDVIVDSFSRAKHDINSFIDDVKKERKDKKEIVGRLKMCIRKESNRDNRVDSSYNSVLPFEDKDSTRRLEVHGFDNPKALHKISVSYVNNLYIYPDKLCIDSLPSSTSLRNVTIEFKLMTSDLDPSAPGLPLVYSKSGNRIMKDKEVTSVWYHSKRPKFNDELKIKLPFNLTEKSHILLTFYHINCKSQKSSKVEREVPFGYAVILLKRSDGFLKPCKSYSANIVPKLPESYLSSSICGEEPEDKAKNYLTYTVNLVSSVYSTDESISKFLLLADSTNQNSAGCIESMKSLSSNALIGEIVKFMPAIFHSLISLISSGDKELSDVAFTTWVSLMNKIIQQDAKTGPSILYSYVCQVFDQTSNKSVNLAFFSISEAWYRCNQTQSEASEACLSVSWAIFLLIIKSMNLWFDERNMLKDESTRSNRLTIESKNVLLELVESLGDQMETKCHNPFFCQLMRRFTIHIGNFFTDLSISCDRGFVFHLIWKYFSRLKTFNLETYGMKCLIIKVMAQHPNFFHLNFPVQPEFKTTQEMIRSFHSRHFLVGLLISLVEQGYKSGMGIAGSEHQKIRELGIDTLAEIFYAIEENPHLNNSIERINVACMFWPFVSLVIEKWDIVLAMPTEERRKNLLCFVWLLYNVPKLFLEYYWSRESEKRISTFFDIIRKVLEEFEYKGQETTLIKRKGNAPRNPLLDIEELLRSNPYGQDIVNKTEPDDSKKKKDKKKSMTTPVAQVFQLSKKSTTRVFSDDENVAKEAEMCSTISGTLLDTILLFMRKFSPALQRLEIFTMTWNPIIDFMKYNQSLEFINALFESISLVLSEHGSHLFKKSNSICSDLMYQTLQKCNSPSKEVRQHAMSLFVELVRINLKEVNNVFRSQLQSTIAIIKIVGQSKSNNFSPLINALKDASNEVKRSELGEKISDVIKKIEEKAHQVISDNVKIQQHQHDPETLSDLQYAISLHLKDSPDERLSWLENLSKHHLSHKNYEESAQTKIVMAGLVQNYLKLLGRWETKMVPAYQHVCPNIDDDIKMSSDLAHLKLLSNELCQSSMFTKEGFVRLLREAIDLLKEGEFYESCVAAYRMILPIFYENDDYAKQKSCYDDLGSLCQKILSVNTMQQRIFSNYYRVSFYGELMGEDMNGVAFIYKEPPTMRVADMTDNILMKYKEKFGQDNVILVPNNENIENITKDRKKIYIQLCNVELHLSKEQLEEKNTGFKQHFGVTRFVMEQPFTRGGGARGTLEDQYIRKTFFTTERMFPFLKKRLRVISVYEEELSPIECAISLIEKRVRALRTELNLSPPNLKNLQRELQGSLLTQVNAGPISIVQIFLSNEKCGSYEEDKRSHLAQSISELERTLAFAVKLNKNSIDGSENQTILQEELEKGYNKLKASLEGCVIFEKLKELKKQKEEEERLKLIEMESKTLMEKKNSFKIEKKHQTNKIDKPNPNSESSDYETAMLKSVKPAVEDVVDASIQTSVKPKKMILSKSQKSLVSKQEISNNKERFNTLATSSKVHLSSRKPEPLTPRSEEEREMLRNSRLKKKEQDLKKSSKAQEETRIRTTSFKNVGVVVDTEADRKGILLTNSTKNYEQKVQSSIDKIVLVVNEICDTLNRSLERIHVALELEELRPLATALKTVKSHVTSISSVIPFEEPLPVKPLTHDDKLEFFKEIVKTEIQNNVSRLSSFISSLRKVDSPQQLTEVIKTIITLKKIVVQM